MSNLTAAAQTIASDYLAKKIGASFYMADNAGSSVVNIVPPASNTKGIVLRSLYMLSTANYLVVADTAAPTGTSDVSKRSIAKMYNGSYTLPDPLFLPAGYGLFAVTDGVTNRLSLTYDIL